ncbi:MAG: acetyl-CoA carboxylase biotin carboxyl carrier protein [Balneolia bacterium]|nr:acetyl-CoA carboxylase biotin carboxyl carrier protein [Balneolia bacterium]
MDLKLIQSLLDMISESDLNEVAIEEGNLKIKVKKQSEAAAPREQVYYAQAPAAPQASAPAAPAAQPAAEKPAAAPSNTEEIKSPIVGTFYAAPNPESPDFVKVGDTIKKGDVLCIVEAMKIMNEIESEVSGKVVKVLVSDAQPVEFDQPLFLIEPN